MNEIIEQFGMCMLAMIPAALLAALFLAMMGPGGDLHEVVLGYMRGICG